MRVGEEGLRPVSKRGGVRIGKAGWLDLRWLRKDIKDVTGSGVMELIKQNSMH